MKVKEAVSLEGRARRPSRRGRRQEAGAPPTPHTLRAGQESFPLPLPLTLAAVPLGLPPALSHKLPCPSPILLLTPTL